MTKMRKLTPYLLIALLAVLSLSPGIRSSVNNRIGVVHADDDKEEEDEKDDEEEEEEDDASLSGETTAPQPITETKSIPVKVVTIAPEYSTDTDGDKLVDAIDPNPDVPQEKYFTDSDSDGVPDAFDQYPDANDFYITADSDDDGNGISDSIEQ
jgi:hypothetical protein